MESSDEVRPELVQQIRDRAIEKGFYAVNMPEALGGGGLDCVSLSLVERELGRANFALQYLVGRPSNILQACQGEQRERYLFPCIRERKTDCLAMTEPAGSDLRSMQCRADKDGAVTTLSTAPNTLSAMRILPILSSSSLRPGEEDSSRGPQD